MRLIKSGAKSLLKKHIFPAGLKVAGDVARGTNFRNAVKHGTLENLGVLQPAKKRAEVGGGRVGGRRGQRRWRERGSSGRKVVGRKDIFGSK